MKKNSVKEEARLKRTKYQADGGRGREREREKERRERRMKERDRARKRGCARDINTRLNSRDEE